MSIDEIRMRYLIGEPTVREVSECIDLYKCWRTNRTSACMSALRSYRSCVVGVAMNKVNG